MLCTIGKRCWVLTQLIDAPKAESLPDASLCFLVEGAKQDLVVEAGHLSGTKKTAWSRATGIQVAICCLIACSLARAVKLRSVSGIERA